MPSVSIKGLASRRGLLALGISLGVVAATITSAAATGGSHNATPAASGQTHNVIVLLRNQHTNLTISKGHTSARLNAYRSDQAPLLSKARTTGARNLHGFSTVNGFSATVTQSQQNQLATDPSVLGVFPDLPVKSAPVSPAFAAGTGPTPSTPQSTTCPSDPAHPLLQPEALQVTNTAFDNHSTPQAQNIVDGTGVDRKSVV